VATANESQGLDSIQTRQAALAMPNSNLIQTPLSSDVVALCSARFGEPTDVFRRGENHNRPPQGDTPSVYSALAMLERSRDHTSAAMEIEMMAHLANFIEATLVPVQPNRCNTTSIRDLYLPENRQNGTRSSP
jgi:hypothetical protein